LFNLLIPKLIQCMTIVWISPAYFKAFESENFISELNLNEIEKAKILSVSDFF
jgi:hypothetical protein